MDNCMMDLTIAIGESGLAIYGKWSASLVESNNLDLRDVSALEVLTGYGDTPLEAAANLLHQAAQLAEKRRTTKHMGRGR